jgi:hypothetical protein
MTTREAQDIATAGCSSGTGFCPGDYFAGNLTRIKQGATEPPDWTVTGPDAGTAPAGECRMVFRRLAALVAEHPELLTD